MAAECTHLDRIKVTQTDKHVCEDCIKTGDRIGLLEFPWSCCRLQPVPDFSPASRIG